MRRRRPRSFGWLERFYLVAVLTLLIGGSMYLDSRGALVDAVVVSRREDIVHRRDPQGTWYRWYRVAVRFPATEAIGAGPTVDVTRERYDSLTIGDTIQVRYLSFFPLLARAANRSTLSAAADRGSRLLQDSFLTSLLFWVAVGTVTLWIASRIGVLAIAAAGLGWLAVGFPLFYPEPPPITLGPSEAMATVGNVTLITKSPDRRPGGRRRHRNIGGNELRRLAQPYQIVEFRYVAPGWRDSVQAVDAIDSASVPGLAFGAVLPIRFDPAAPREARLAQGARTFHERNRYHLMVSYVGVGVVGMLAAWGANSRRKRRQG